MPLISISNDKTNPWFTKQLRTLRNKKKRSYNTAKRNDSASCWEKYKVCLQEYCKALGAAKKKYYSQDLPSLIKNNPKKFWQIISPYNKSSNSITLHDAKQTPLSNEASAIAFSAYFASVFTKEDCSNVPFVPDQPFPFMAPITVTAEGIANLIMNLKVST